MPQGCHPTGRQAREQRQLDQAARQAEREQARGKQQQEREVRAVLSRLLTQVAHAARTRNRTSTRTL